MTIENLKDIIRKTAILDDVDKLNPDVSFKEQGIDSLDVASILLKIEKEYHVDLIGAGETLPSSLREILTSLSRGVEK